MLKYLKLIIIKDRVIFINQLNYFYQKTSLLRKLYKINYMPISASLHKQTALLYMRWKEQLAQHLLRHNETGHS